MSGPDKLMFLRYQSIDTDSQTMLRQKISGAGELFAVNSCFLSLEDTFTECFLISLPHTYLSWLNYLHKKENASFYHPMEVSTRNVHFQYWSFFLS